MSKSLTRSIGEGLAGNALYAVVFGSGGVLAILKVWYPEWLPVAGWFLAGSALAGVIVASLTLLRRLPKPAPEVTTDNAEANIRAWLETFRVGTKTHDIDQSKFAIEITLENSFKSLIHQPKALGARYVLIESFLEIGKEDKVEFDKLPIQEQAVFGAQLKVELAKTGMGFGMDLAKNKVSLNRRVPITANLNEGTFMEAIEVMDSARQRVLMTMSLMLLDLQMKRKQLESKGESIMLPAPKTQV